MFNSNIANIYISIFIIFISEIASTYIDLIYLWILDTDFCGRTYLCGSWTQTFVDECARRRIRPQKSVDTDFLRANNMAHDLGFRV